MNAWHDLDRLLCHAPGCWSGCVQLPGQDVIYAYNADAIRPSASLIKVPLAMALVAMNDGALQQEQIDLDVSIVLHEKDRVPGEGELDMAPAGTVRTRWELIRHLLRESDNTAGNLLIDVIGMDAMNDFVAELPLNLQHTRLRRRFMDFAAAAAGRDNTTTAREICRVLDALLAGGPRLARLVEWLSSTPYKQRLVAGVPPHTVVAHKVGDLNGVEHDAGIVFAPAGPYIVALLSVDLPEPGIGDAVIAEASRIIYQHMGAR